MLFFVWNICKTPMRTGLQNNIFTFVVQVLNYGVGGMYTVHYDYTVSLVY